jgi:outer membrane lipoprotein
MRIAIHSLRYSFGLLLALMLVACAPEPIYKNVPNAIAAPPALVAQAPERYAGGDVIWGGQVVQVTTFANHSEIELLAYPLDSSQRPQMNDIGNGRFIAVMPGFVEPLNFPPGALITISGKLNGSRVGAIGEASYVFPLVSVGQSHVWTPKEMNQGRNNVQFGVGVGVGIR